MKTLIVIGASNVTLSLPEIWSAVTAQHLPHRLFAVAGHGRSFGMPSTALGRTLPGILNCGLWEALPELLARTPDGHTEETPPTALITDVGNDILYGAPVTRIVDWVEESVVRLSEAGVAPRLTHLPLDSLRSLTPRRFHMFRSLLFPSSTLDFLTALEQAEKLDAALSDLADRWNLHRPAPQADWYGTDPIHIRRAARPEAWRFYLSPDLQGCLPPQLRMHRRYRLWTRKAALRWRRGRQFVTPQPCLIENPHELWLF